ncbi:MAG TPA: ABATE domain-containing protein [Terriglobales bacterium]
MQKPATKNNPAKPFDFVGGSPALDFCNTVSWRWREGALDYLSRPAELVRWIREAGLQGNIGELRMTNADLRRARRLRDSLFAAFHARITANAPSRLGLAVINKEIARCQKKRRLMPAANGFTWKSSPRTIDRLVCLVIEDAAALLTSELGARVRVCEGPGCGWLFLDRSKNLPRRWCSMKDCGNKAKAQRHYRRARTRQSD